MQIFLYHALAGLLERVLFSSFIVFSVFQLTLADGEHAELVGEGQDGS